MQPSSSLLTPSEPYTFETALSLESPLSSEELLIALQKMKPGKIPGPDGLTAQYYKSFSAQLLHFIWIRRVPIILPNFLRPT